MLRGSYALFPISSIGLATVVLWNVIGASAATSGPNASGYQWVDNKPPDPQTTFDWIDIASPSNRIAVIDNEDDAAATGTLPFTFNYFGADYNQVAIGTNGFLSFNVADPDDCNNNYNDLTGEGGSPIPHGHANCEDGDWGADPLVAVWFDDLDPGDCGSVYAQGQGSAPNRMFIVEYRDVCHNDCDDCAAGDGVTFEVILYEGTNDIKVQYQDTFFGTGPDYFSEENYGGTATTGISRDGATGLQHHVNSTSLSDGLAVLYTSHGSSTPTPTPTPLPTPFPFANGDVDCNGSVTSVDSLKILRFVAQLPSGSPGCQDIGASANFPFGDVDCNSAVNSVDALKILRYVAGLPVSKTEPCPDIGTTG